MNARIIFLAVFAAVVGTGSADTSGCPHPGEAWVDLSQIIILFQNNMLIVFLD